MELYCVNNFYVNILHIGLCYVLHIHGRIHDCLVLNRIWNNFISNFKQISHSIFHVYYYCIGMEVY